MTKSSLLSSIRLLFNNYGGEASLEAKVVGKIKDFLASLEIGDTKPTGAQDTPLAFTLHDSPKNDVVTMLAKHFDIIGEPDPDIDHVIALPNGHITVQLNSDGDYDLTQGSHCTTITREDLIDYRRTTTYEYLMLSYSSAKQDMETQEERLYQFILGEIKPFIDTNNFRQAMLFVVTLKLVNCDPTRRAVGYIFERALNAGAEGYAQLLDIEIPVARASMDTRGVQHEPK